MKWKKKYHLKPMAGEKYVCVIILTLFNFLSTLFDFLSEINQKPLPPQDLQDENYLLYFHC